MCRVVYLIRSNFYPPFNGERVKTAVLASALAAAGELTVIDLGREHFPGPRYPVGDRFKLPYGGEASFYSSARVNHWFADGISRITGKPYEPKRLWRTKSARYQVAQQLIESLRPDVVVVDHPLMAALALQAPAKIRIIHTHNVESELAGAAAAKNGKRRHRKRVELFEQIERVLLPRFDQVWGVREEDLVYYRQLGVRHTVLTPNVICNGAFEASPTVGEPGRVVMFSWLRYGPNAEAAHYMVEFGERAAAAGQPLRISLVGRDPDSALVESAQKYDWLELPGFVSSLQPHVQKAALIAVPLAWGAGTKLKVLEALAMGKPLVTTPVGAEGIDIEDGVHALIRPLGPSFDEAVLIAARSPEQFQAMACRGRDFVRERYSQETLMRIVGGALGQS